VEWGKCSCLLSVPVVLHCYAQTLSSCAHPLRLIPLGVLTTFPVSPRRLSHTELSCSSVQNVRALTETQHQSFSTARTMKRSPPSTKLSPRLLKKGRRTFIPASGLLTKQGEANSATRTYPWLPHTRTKENSATKNGKKLKSCMAAQYQRALFKDLRCRSNLYTWSWPIGLKY
jgi:hypothetical protein